MESSGTENIMDRDLSEDVRHPAEERAEKGAEVDKIGEEKTESGSDDKAKAKGDVHKSETVCLPSDVVSVPSGDVVSVPSDDAVRESGNSVQAKGHELEEQCELDIKSEVDSILKKLDSNESEIGEAQKKESILEDPVKGLEKDCSNDELGKNKEISQVLGKDEEISKVLGKDEETSQDLEKDKEISQALGKDEKISQDLGENEISQDCDKSELKNLKTDSENGDELGKDEEISQVLGKDKEISQDLGKDEEKSQDFDESELKNLDAGSENGDELGKDKEISQDFGKNEEISQDCDESELKNLETDSENGDELGKGGTTLDSEECELEDDMEEPSSPIIGSQKSVRKFDPTSPDRSLRTEVRSPSKSPEIGFRRRLKIHVFDRELARENAKENTEKKEESKMALAENDCAKLSSKEENYQTESSHSNSKKLRSSEMEEDLQSKSDENIELDKSSSCVNVGHSSLSESSEVESTLDSFGKKEKSISTAKDAAKIGMTTRTDENSPTLSLDKGEESVISDEVKDATDVKESESSSCVSYLRKEERLAGAKVEDETSTTVFSKVSKSSSYAYGSEDSTKIENSAFSVENKLDSLNSESESSDGDFSLSLSRSPSPCVENLNSGGTVDVSSGPNNYQTDGGEILSRPESPSGDKDSKDIIEEQSLNSSAKIPPSHREGSISARDLPSFAEESCESGRDTIAEQASNSFEKIYVHPKKMSPSADPHLEEECKENDADVRGEEIPTKDNPLALEESKEKEMHEMSAEGEEMSSERDLLSLGTSEDREQDDVEKTTSVQPLPSSNICLKDNRPSIKSSVDEKLGNSGANEKCIKDIPVAKAEMSENEEQSTDKKIKDSEPLEKSVSCTKTVLPTEKSASSSDGPMGSHDVQGSDFSKVEDRTEEKRTTEIKCLDIKRNNTVCTADAPEKAEIGITNIQSSNDERDVSSSKHVSAESNDVSEKKIDQSENGAKSNLKDSERNSTESSEVCAGKKGQEDKSAAAKRQEDNIAAAKGQEDKSVATKGQEDKSAAAKGQEDKCAAAKGQDDRSAAAKGQEDKISAAKGQEDKSAAAKRQEDNIAAAKGQEDKSAAAKGQEDRSAAAKGQEDKISAAKGQEDKSAAAKRQENNIAAAKGQEDKSVATKGQEDKSAAAKRQENNIAAAKGQEDKNVAAKQQKDNIAAAKEQEGNSEAASKEIHSKAIMEDELTDKSKTKKKTLVEKEKEIHSDAKNSTKMRKEHENSPNTSREGIKPSRSESGKITKVGGTTSNSAEYSRNVLVKQNAQRLQQKTLPSYPDKASKDIVVTIGTRVSSNTDRILHKARATDDEMGRIKAGESSAATSAGEKLTERNIEVEPEAEGIDESDPLKLTAIDMVCNKCRSIWSERILLAIFKGTECVTVVSKITYGAIVCMSNWINRNIEGNKTEAIKNVFERADLGRNTEKLNMEHLDDWLFELLQNRDHKCCQVFTAVYKSEESQPAVIPQGSQWTVSSPTFKHTGVTVEGKLTSNAATEGVKTKQSDKKEVKGVKVNASASATKTPVNENDFEKRSEPKNHKELRTVNAKKWEEIKILDKTDSKEKEYHENTTEDTDEDEERLVIDESGRKSSTNVRKNAKSGPKSSANTCKENAKRGPESSADIRKENAKGVSGSSAEISKEKLSSGVSIQQVKRKRSLKENEPDKSGMAGPAKLAKGTVKPQNPNGSDSGKAKKIIECIDLSDDDEDDHKNAIFHMVCEKCRDIWRDDVLLAIFKGTECVTVNSKVTYGAIVCINNWLNDNLKVNKAEAMKGIFERADLGKNIEKLNIDHLDSWLYNLLNSKKHKCCDVFTAVYESEPQKVVSLKRPDTQISLLNTAVPVPSAGSGQQVAGKQVMYLVPGSMLALQQSQGPTSQTSSVRTLMAPIFMSQSPISVISPINIINKISPLQGDPSGGFISPFKTTASPLNIMAPPEKPPQPSSSGLSTAKLSSTISATNPPVGNLPPFSSAPSSVKVVASASVKPSLPSNYSFAKSTETTSDPPVGFSPPLSTPSSPLKIQTSTSGVPKAGSSLRSFPHSDNSSIANSPPEFCESFIKRASGIMKDKSVIDLVDKISPSTEIVTSNSSPPVISGSMKTYAGPKKNISNPDMPLNKNSLPNRSMPPPDMPLNKSSLPNRSMPPPDMPLNKTSSSFKSPPKLPLNVGSTPKRSTPSKIIPSNFSRSKMASEPKMLSENSASSKSTPPKIPIGKSSTDISVGTDMASKDDSEEEAEPPEEDLMQEEEEEPVNSEESLELEDMLEHLGLDLEQCNIYSSHFKKPITNMSKCESPTEDDKASPCYFSMVKERSVLTGYTKLAFDILLYEANNLDSQTMVYADKMDSSRFVTKRELLTLQSIFILNPEKPDINLFYQVFVQILLSRKKTLLIPDSHTLLVVTENIRKVYNREKSKKLSIQILNEDWDPHEVYSAKDLWLADNDSPQFTNRDIISVFCTWKNLEKKPTDEVLPEAITAICRSQGCENIDSFGLCFRLYIKFCRYLFEEKNIKLAETFLNEPFFGPDCIISHDVLVKLTNSRKRKMVWDFEEEGILQDAMENYEKLVSMALEKLTMPLVQDLCFSLTVIQEKLDAYSSASGELGKRLSLDVTKRGNFLKQMHGTRMTLLNSMRSNLTSTYRILLDRCQRESALKRKVKKRKVLSKNKHVDSISENANDEDVPSHVRRLIEDLLCKGVRPEKVLNVINSICENAGVSNTLKLPSEKWIKNFAKTFITPELI